MGRGVCFRVFVLLAAFCSLSSYKAFPDIAASHSTVLCWDQNSLAKQRKPFTYHTPIGHLCPQSYHNPLLCNLSSFEYVVDLTSSLGGAQPGKRAL